MDDPRIQELIKEQQEKIKKKMEEGNFDINEAISDVLDDVKGFFDNYEEKQDDSYEHASKEDILALDDDELLVALSEKIYRITEDCEDDEAILEALNPAQTVYYVLDTLGDACLEERFGDFLIDEPTLIALVPEALNTISAHNFEMLYTSFFNNSGLDVNTFTVDVDVDEDLEDAYDRIYDQYALYYFDEAFTKMNEQSSYNGLLSRYLRAHIDEVLEGVED